MSGLWLYGIGRTAPGGAPLGAGIGGAEISCLPVSGFIALVSAAPAERPAATRRHMLAHTAVLERATGAIDMLPVRFGTVAPSEGELARCLHVNAGALDQALAGIAGRIELGLRISWKEGVVYEEILAADPALRALRDRLARRPGVETTPQRVELGRRVEAALLARRAAEAASLAAKLDALADRVAELGVAEDAMVLNRAFLVPRAAEPRFDAAVAAMEAEHGRRLAFRYVGPVPAFNFVRLNAAWLAAA